MNNAKRVLALVVSCLVSIAADRAQAQDWPQWRGPNRDAKAAGFIAPATWPKELTKKWKVTVGDSDGTPALVGQRLYVFSRQGTEEVVRCLDAATGGEVWQDKYPSAGATGAAARHPGPRSSPTVAEGKVVTFGINGTLNCYDAAGGSKVWSKDFFNPRPMFFTSCSPVVANGLCIVQLGGEQAGSIVAFDMASGSEKWKWADDGTAYSSPVLFALDGAQEVVTVTNAFVVGLNAADGKLIWKVPFAVTGRGWNSSTPIVDGSTIIFSGIGRGTKAVKLEKAGSEITTREVWNIKDNGVQYNTPIVKNGLVFGISDRDILFCINTTTNQTAWTFRFEGGGGFGSVVDAGSVLVALNPSGKLIVFEPTDKEFKELAHYQVAEGGTHAYPILSGNRLFIKDKDSVALLAIE